MTPGDNVIGYLISWASIVTGILVSVSGQGTWWLAIAVAVQIIAWCAGASGIVCAVLTVPVVAALAHAVVYRARRQVAPEVGADTIGMLYEPCRPCNSHAGRCTCAGHCGHPDCVGDYTTLRDMRAELAAMLGEEGKQQ